VTSDEVAAAIGLTEFASKRLRFRHSTWAGRCSG